MIISSKVVTWATFLTNISKDTNLKIFTPLHVKWLVFKKVILLVTWVTVTFLADISTNSTRPTAPRYAPDTPNVNTKTYTNTTRVAEVGWLSASTK